MHSYPHIAILQEFLIRGRPCRVLGRKGIQTSLFSILRMVPEAMTLQDIGYSMEQMLEEDYENELRYDFITCVQEIIRHLPVDPTCRTGRAKLIERIEELFGGAENPAGNIPEIGTGHQAKGLQWRTVMILEPATMMLRTVLARGGLNAEDEAHLKHVLVSRACYRLFFLLDVFFTNRIPGVGALFHRQIAPTVVSHATPFHTPVIQPAAPSAAIPAAPPAVAPAALSAVTPGAL